MTLVERSAYTVCSVDSLTVGRGVAALIDGRSIAVFLLADGSVHAIDNVDPCSGAGVLSRGVIGDCEGVPVVASPMYKQRFDLRSGTCLDADASIAVHRASCIDGVVRVQLDG